MAPARRASVRRSRRLSEQQPSAPGSDGARTKSAEDRSQGKRGVGGDEGGMSCDEDLEGMVVDLSFEGVADDPTWRQADRPSIAGREEAGGKGVVRQGGGGSEAGRRSTGAREAPEGRDRRGRVRRPGVARFAQGGKEAVVEGDDAAENSAGSQPESGGRSARHAPAASEATDRCREAPLSTSAHSSGSGGGSVHPQPQPTPPAASQPSRASSAAIAAGLNTPLPPGVEDIDAESSQCSESHLCNPDYSQEHAAYLRVQETRNRPSAYIGVRQRDMRQNMRSVLVDWIVEVCDQFKLSSRTLFQVSRHVRATAAEHEHKPTDSRWDRRDPMNSACVPRCCSAVAARTVLE